MPSPQELQLSVNDTRIFLKALDEHGWSKAFDGLRKIANHNGSGEILEVILNDDKTITIFQGEIRLPDKIL